MPLVAYESSDDEDSQGEEIIETPVSVTTSSKDDPKKQVTSLAGPSGLETVQVNQTNGSKRKDINIDNDDDDEHDDVKRVNEELPGISGEPSRLSVLEKLSETGGKSSLPVSIATGLSDIVVVDKKSKKIKVVIPSLDEMDYDSEEEEEAGPKRKITPAGGCSLTSFLPKPKNATSRFAPSIFSTPTSSPLPASSSSTSKPSTTINPSVASLIPHSISRPKTNIPPLKRPKNMSVKSTDEDDDAPINFFSLGDVPQSTKQLDSKIDKIIPVVKPKFEPELIYNETLIPKSRIDEISTNYDYNVPTSSASNYYSKKPATSNVNDPEFKKFVASKFGEEPAEKIDIVEVNVGSYLSADHELLKTVSLESGPTAKGPAPSALAKRKNQITYLAYQAKQRELDLKNQAAANKFTKSQTRARYGF